MKIYTCFFTLCLLLLLLTNSHAVSNTEDKSLADVQSGKKSNQEDYQIGDPALDVAWIDENNGEYLPLDTYFKDENGNKISLGEIIDRPTLILPIYFYCPNSCSLNLVNLATAIKRSSLKPGKDFKVIAFSFNELENEENARIAKRNYLRLLPKDFSSEDWKFLTGTKQSIEAVTNSIGYKFMPRDDGTFIHPSALVVSAEDGMIIKYVYGKFPAGDVDIAISEAKRGTPALSIKRFLGYCFNYAPEKSRSFFQNLKISVLIGFALLGVLFFLYLKRTGRKKTTSTDEH